MSHIKLLLGLVMPVLLLAGPALADGDAAKGQKEFRKCAACHALEAGKNKVGPSLHSVYGREAGAAEGYKYSESYIEAGKKGLKWDDKSLSDYLADPKGFLNSYLGTTDAKSKMLFKLAKEDAREDVIAYLKTVK